MRQPRDTAITRIEIVTSARGLGEWVIAPIVVAHAVAILAVAARRAEGLDPGVLVRRNSLRRKLPSHPIRFFRQDDVHAIARCGERRRAASYSAADHGDIATQLACETQAGSGENTTCCL